MNFPAELKYSRDDEWVKMLDDSTALVGISDYAQNEMGDLVFINLPVVGDAVTKDEMMCDIESVKAVADVISPVSGTVAEVNEALLDAPETLNGDPYGAWIAKIENISDFAELLSADEYKEYRGV
ncbi:MAG: glycine cleavage system protein GcvH [Oscillospiraceae bacterium]